MKVITEERWRREKLNSNSLYLRKALLNIGLNVVDAPTSIISIETGSHQNTARLRKNLEARGVFGAVFIPPASPPDQCLVRLSVNTELTMEKLDRIVEACQEIQDKMT